MESSISEIPNILTMDGYQKPKHILVIGCGGTGAYVIAHLARFIHSINKASRYDQINLTIADGDKVEEKNLNRQHFIKSDLEGNKAEVLASRYSAAFGSDINAVPSYLESKKSLDALNPNLIIGCVDNNASRKVIHNWILHDDNSYYASRFWIDSGNEENSGQVICGYYPSCNKSYTNQFSLPFVTEIYPNLLKDVGKLTSELSCAEMAESSPQNMMANITAATIILNFTQKLILGQPLKTHGVIFSVDNFFRPLLNTKENLLKVAKSRRRSWEKIP